MLLTVIMNAAAMVFIYVVAIPIGIFAATHQYSVGDHALTVVSLTGLATPQFLLALVLMVFMVRNFGAGVGGLFSPEYVDAAWSVGRFFDLLAHLPVPVIIIGLSGTAALIRVMRSGVLDELKKQYVVTARAKGATERALLFKYRCGWRSTRSSARSAGCCRPLSRAGRSRRWCSACPRWARCCCAPCATRTCSWAAPSSCCSAS